MANFNGVTSSSTFGDLVQQTSLLPVTQATASKHWKIVYRYLYFTQWATVK